MKYRMHLTRGRWTSRSNRRVALCLGRSLGRGGLESLSEPSQCMGMTDKSFSPGVLGMDKKIALFFFFLFERNGNTVD